MSLTFISCSLCVSSASSKAERPPSLSLYPSGEGMVRGGLGGARMMPGKDIWQVSELGQSTFCLSGGTDSGHVLLFHDRYRRPGGVEGGGAGLTAARPASHTHTHTDHQPLPRLLVSLLRKLFYSHLLEICSLKSDLLGLYVDSSKQGSIVVFSL